MIRLNLPTEPYWLDLPLGVRLLVRPLDTAVYEACRYRAVRNAKRKGRPAPEVRRDETATSAPSNDTGR